MKKSAKKKLVKLQTQYKEVLEELAPLERDLKGNNGIVVFTPEDIEGLQALYLLQNAIDVLQTS